MKKLAAVGLALLFFLINISFSQNAFAASQIQVVCKVVKQWPNDIVKVWPKAVAFHNKAPEKNTAASYMNSSLESFRSLAKINDKKALNILQGYEAYWSQLESDYIHSGGKRPPASSPSTTILAMVMKLCTGVRDF